MDRSVGCMWEALAMGKEVAVKKMDVGGFDWQSPHKDFGSPIHAILFGKIREEREGKVHNGNKAFGNLIVDSAPGKKSRMALLRIAMENGANAYIAAPTSCNLALTWTRNGKKTEPVDFDEKSAFESLLEIERALKQLNDDAWAGELKAITEALEILCSPNSSSSGVAVPEGLIEAWERILADQDSMDVVLRTESSGAVEQVRAHSAVLRGASPVLQAMLSTSGMREACQKIVEVAGCSCEALQLLRSLIYTGSSSSSASAGDDEPVALGTMLSALELAHRWQVIFVVQMLANAIAQRVNMANLEAAMDAAMRLQLPPLLSACCTFAKNHERDIRARLSARGATKFQSSGVCAELEKVLNGGGRDGQQKRRRKAL